jgi:hypothetical protein
LPFTTKKPCQGLILTRLINIGIGCFLYASLPCCLIALF